MKCGILLSMLFWHLLGGIAAKIGLGFSLIFSPATTLSPLPPPLPLSSTPLVLAPEPVTPVATSSPAVESKKETPPAASSTPSSPKPAPSAPKPAPTPVPVPAPIPEPVPAPSLLPAGSNINDVARAALVNIICTTQAGGSLKPISGSGVIVDDRGIVLTNAHVAQFFLLRDYPTQGNVECVLRAGSPARTLYTAKLLFFPSAWMTANAHKIVEETPTGTGQNDYAFLLITGRTDGSPLPSSFPSLTPSIREPDAGEDVLLAGYPAGFLDGISVQMNLFISSAKTSISSVFTFQAGGGADLVSIGGTILSQHGSSGGAVVSARDASLIGTIVTATHGETTAERDLRAITLHHINESYKVQTSETLADLFSGDISQKAAMYGLTRVPSLSRALIEALER